MKTVFCLAVLGFLAAGPASGGVTTYADNFEDGVRNKALWSVDNNLGGRLVETGGRLYGYSGVLYPAEDFQGSTWFQKPALTVVDNDEVMVEAILRLPLLPVPAGAGAYYAMEIGLTVPGSSPEKSVFLWYNRFEKGRSFSLNVYKGDGTSIAWSFWPPGDLARYYIRMRYRPSTGEFTLWCRSGPLEKWTKLKTINVDTEWNLWPGSPVSLQAYLGFGSYKARIEEIKYLYFDNFKMTLTRP